MEELYYGILQVAQVICNGEPFLKRSYGFLSHDNSNRFSFLIRYSYLNSPRPRIFTGGNDPHRILDQGGKRFQVTSHGITKGWPLFSSPCGAAFNIDMHM